MGHYPESLLRHLQTEVLGFAKESERCQRGFTQILWINSISKRYKHRSEKGAFFLGWKKINEIFGQNNFKAANGRIKMFDDSKKDWKHSRIVKGKRVEYKIKEGKAYKITKIGRDAFQSYQCKEIENGENLIDMITGKRIKTAPKNAIKSRNSKNIKVKSKMKIPGLVAINVEAIIQAFQYLKQVRDARLSGSQPPTDKWLDSVFTLPDEKVDDWLDYRINQLTGLCVMAHSTVAPRGFIYQRYEEAQSGRLYSADQTITLQNVAREVRSVALRGHGWDHDFENCHFVLFADLAEHHGVECPSIRHYITNKKIVRKDLAKEIGVEVSKVKEALISLIYGSRNTLFPEAAIPAILGEDKADELYATSIYKNLKFDIDAGTKVIIKNCQRSNGKLKNAMGKCLSLDALDEKGKPEKDRNGKVKPQPIPKQLGHILQGLEAKLLNIVGETNPGKLLVLMHDGFLAKEKLDTDHITQTIAKETLSSLGIEIQMELDAKEF